MKHASTSFLCIVAPIAFFSPSTRVHESGGQKEEGEQKHLFSVPRAEQ